MHRFWITPRSTSHTTAIPTFNESFLTHTAIQTLIHPDCLGNPVELETVDNSRLLGFNLDLAQRTITYIQPTAPFPKGTTHVDFPLLHI